MPAWPEFVGGFYTARSPNIANQLAVNIYTETIEVSGAAKQRFIYGTPGTVTRATAATAGGRGCFEQDGVLLAVVGAVLYDVDPVTFVPTALGTIIDDGNPVSFASNGLGGDQIGMVGGGQLKVLDTTTMTLSAAIALPFSDPVQIVFIDGYALINERDTPKVWFSALEDMTTWDALDFFTRSGSSDNIVSLQLLRDRIVPIGSKTTTLFYDSGDADTPFLPYPGSVMPYGAVSAWAAWVHKDVVYWVAQGDNSSPCVVSFSGGTAQIVSPPPIAKILASASTLTDAEMLVYTQEEHTFVTVTCPALGVGGQTWCYDVREKEWHQRGPWDPDQGDFLRWRARGACAVGGQIVVGDFETGAISTLDLDVQEDVRLRRAPYLSPENAVVGFSAFELGIQAGVGTSAAGQGHDPTVTLRLSRDSGHTWESAGTSTLGQVGEYAECAIWTMLGQVRLDRLVIEVSQSDPVRCVWSAPWLRITSGLRNH